MRPMLVVPPTAVERIEPLLRAAGWRAMSLPGEGEADRDAVFDAVARGDPVVSAPDRGAPAVRLRRIMVVHQGSRGDRAGMDLADEAALTSGAEVVVVHVPSAVADPTAGSLAFRIADRGGYDLDEWREEFIRRFCRCSPGVRVRLRVGAGSAAALRDQVRSESPDLIIVSGPPGPGAGEGWLVDAVLEDEVPVLIVPPVGRDRSAQANAERGQRQRRDGHPSAGPTLHVRDVMTTAVVSVDPSTPLKQVAQVLVDHRISGVPVVDADGAVLGVVSEADFVVKGQGTDPAVPQRRFAWLLGESPETRAQREKFAATVAREAMTAPAITTGPDQAIADAARLMTERRVNRLPVVEDGKLVGIIARADIVRTYLRSDPEIAEAVREHVLRDTMRLDPRRFVVEVDDGRVSIGGSIDLRSGAEIIERLVRMVPGVVDVDANVTWSLDDEDVEEARRDQALPFRTS